jgi:hypothetical protein
MLGKTILRVESITLEHEAVTLDLSNNAGRRDAEAYAITSDQRGLRTWEIGDRQAVDESVSRAWRELFDHCTHPRMRCAEDIETVNFLRGDCNGSPPNFGIACDFGVESFADLGREFFGVSEATQNKIRWEDDCAYDDRASEWSTTCLIDACDGVEIQCG